MRKGGGLYNENQQVLSSRAALRIGEEGEDVFTRLGKERQGPDGVGRRLPKVAMK